MIASRWTVRPLPWSAAAGTCPLFPFALALFEGAVRLAMTYAAGRNTPGVRRRPGPLEANMARATRSIAGEKRLRSPDKLLDLVPLFGRYVCLRARTLARN
jgi:hypothetical protein